MSHSVSVQGCDNWSSFWWSHGYLLRKLHTTISKFDSPSNLLCLWWRVLAWSMINTKIVFSISLSPFLQLLSEVLRHKDLYFYMRFILIQTKSYIWKVRHVYPCMSLPVHSLGCFQGMGVPMCCLRSKRHCGQGTSLCECQCDCHSFSSSLTWMNGQPGYHGNDSHDSHWCSEPSERKWRILCCMEALYGTPILIWPCGILLVFAWNPQALIISSTDVKPNYVPLVY